MFTNSGTASAEILTTDLIDAGDHAVPLRREFPDADSDDRIA